ncbi:MAG: alpha/beta fold hydrolase [Nocardioidaceae bacterium]|nr:alpha/beta fold hydrolase [Nocardioidaceae bacterium]
MQILTDTPLRQPPVDYCPPGSEQWFTIPDGPDRGRRMFYFDHLTGPGEPEGTVLLVHGAPECSYTYRHIVSSLIASGRTIRIVAMDHLGYGLSDQASFEMIDVHHSANVAMLVRALGLREVTMVVHDWGGPIGIGALIDEPDRLQNLVVLNSTIFPMPAEGFTYRNFPITWLPWSRTPHVVPDRWWGGVAAYVVPHARPQSTARFLTQVTRWIVRHGAGRIRPEEPEYVWSQMLQSSANGRSAKRMCRHTARWGYGYSYRDRRLGQVDNFAFYHRFGERVSEAWGPQGSGIGVAGHFGAWDACGKSSVIDQWHHALPQLRAHTHVYPELGHFIEEDRGPQITASLLALLDGAV